ncbi:MAG: PAS domain S-box protein [Methanomicrobiales archaeon]|nr:PAS domain S-box protein [Methanomicrobiales archaeon]
MPKIHVLYVDDEPDLLELGKIYLEMNGEFLITTADRGNTALLSLGTTPFDVIVSDYQMPEMDGITLLKQVRSRHATIPFILFTGRGREEVVVEALNNGADFYLQKGGDPKAQFAELTQKIRLSVSRRRAEQALAQSETRFRELTEHSLDTIMLFDHDLRHLYVNPNVELQAGIPATQFIGKTHAEMGFPNELVTAWEQKLRGVFASGSTDRSEFQLPNGTWIDWLLVPVKDETGSVIQVITSARDITERRKSEDELRAASARIAASEEELRANYDELAKKQQKIRESEALFRGLFDQAFQLAAVLDTRGTLIRINRSALSLIGENASGVLGRPFWETPWWNPGSEDQLLVKEAVLLAARGETRRFETQHTDRRGNLHFIDFSMKPVTDENGMVIALLPEGRDITGLKLAEGQLRESEQTKQALLDATYDAILLVDTSRKIIDVNGAFARRMGKTPPDLVGRNLTELFAPEVLERREALFEEVLRNKKAITFEDERNGLFLENTFYPVCDASGEVKNFAIFSRDITAKKHADEALRRSEERFRTIADTIPGVLYQFYARRNGDMGLYYVSERSDDIFGIGGDTATFFPRFTACVAPEDRERFLHSIADAVRKKTLWDFHGRYIRPEGKEMFFHGRSEPVETGDELVFHGMLLDTTGQARAEQALIASEARYHSLFDNAADPIFIMDNEKITDCNPATLRIFRCTREQIIGHTPIDLSPPEQPGGGSSRDLAMEQIHAAIAGQPRFFPWTHCTADGTPFPAEITLSRFTHGGTTSILAIVRDKSREIEAMESLQKSEGKYRAIIEHMQDMFYRTDTGGTITMVSPSAARFLGTATPEELIGRNIRSFYLDPADHDRMLEEMQKTGLVEGYLVNLKKADGTSLAATVSSHPLHGPDDRISGVEGILHDITAMQEAGRTLQIANRKLNLLNSITRHDMLNQLMVLMGFLELARKIPADATLTDYLEKCARITENLDRQISFTRDYQNMGIRMPVWQNINKIVRTCTSDLMPAKRISITGDCNDWEVYADPLLEKVFFNLIENSLIHGGPDLATIRFVCMVHNRNLVIACEDDGEGIAADDKPRIFERGYGKKTGLGLFLSREILSITNITITENSEPGKGARFTITVPKGVFRQGSGTR